MSKRTADLPPLTGIPHLIREWRNDEFSRQAVGILLVSVYGWFGAPYAPLFWPGAVIAVCGIAVRMYASGFIMKNKELATVGPYAMVRHPLYTGNILVLIGLCLASGAWWSWVVGLLFLWFWYPPAIEYEDRKLNGIFGEAWVTWSRGTPALMPRRFSTGTGPAQWSLLKSLKQNAEPLVVIWVLFWLWWLWRQLP